MLRESAIRLMGTIALLLAALCVTPSVLAEEGAGKDPLEQRIEALEQKLQTLKTELGKAKQTEAEVKKLKDDLAETKQVAQKAGKEARAEEEADHKFHLAGYAFAGFEGGDKDPDSFLAGAFNPIFHYQYKDLLLFESELQIETDIDGATDLALEYADLAWFVTDYATIKAGKWLSPIGQFQERLHPAWINKLPDAPAGFGHGGAQPLSDVGVQVRGGIPIGKESLFTYVFAAGNGPRLGHHGVELEGFGRDDNSNKSLGGRIGFLPFPYLEFGASYLTADLDGEERAEGVCDAVGPSQACRSTDAGYDLWGVDFAFTQGPWDVRAEYLMSELDSLFSREGHGEKHTSLLPKTDWDAWYVQSAYQLRGITNNRFLNKLEFVGRYSELDVDGFDEFKEDNEERITFGVNYLIAPSIIMKLAYQNRDFENADSDDVFRAQLAYGF